MFCEACKTKDASVFLTQIIDGGMQKLNLCESCSVEKGIDDPAGFALADMLLGIGVAALEVAQEIKKSSVMITCSSCGLSQSDFKKRGRLGCGACYETFAEDLSVILRTMHRDTMHRGKVPAKFAVTRAHRINVETLQATLEKAITEEQYEQAALLRDKLTMMQQDIPSSQDIQLSSHPHSLSCQDSEMSGVVPESVVSKVQGILPLEETTVVLGVSLKKKITQAKRKKS